MEKLGVIAGNRKFPLLLAEAAKERNYYIVAVAVKRDTERDLRKYVDKIYWLSLAEFSRLFNILKSEGITQVVMAGQISPQRLFSPELNQDPLLKDILLRIKDKRADTIFGAVAQELAKQGINLLDSTLFLKDFLPKKGLLTSNNPDKRIWEDAQFAFGLAKEMGKLDIGQSVAVKGKAIVAVEALEGTDNLIRRAGALSRGGFVLVKTSKPNQDTRFDIPVVGLQTVCNLIKAKAACLAIEADKTLFIDKEESIKLANRKGLAILAL